MSVHAVHAPAAWRPPLPSGLHALSFDNGGVILHTTRGSRHVGADTRVFRGELPPLGATPQRGSVDRLRGVLPAVRRALRRWGSPEGLLGAIAETTETSPFSPPAIAILAVGSDTALADLVGLGVGLTPAGDDFLAGVLALRQLLSEGGGSELRAALAPCLHRTTPAGRTLLWAALRGQFPAFLCRLLDQLTRPAGTTEPVAAAVRAAVRHGHSSGTDAVTGVVWELQRRAAVAAAGAQATATGAAAA